MNIWFDAAPDFGNAPETCFGGTPDFRNAPETCSGGTPDFGNAIPNIFLIKTKSPVY